MAIYENGNNGISSIRFDDNTILEVGQPGGGGSGVGGPMGLYAKNLITGESTSGVIAELEEDIEYYIERTAELEQSLQELAEANGILTSTMRECLIFKRNKHSLIIKNNTSATVDIAVMYASRTIFYIGRAGVIPTHSTIAAGAQITNEIPKIEIYSNNTYTQVGSVVALIIPSDRSITYEAITQLAQFTVGNSSIYMLGINTNGTVNIT